MSYTDKEIGKIINDMVVIVDTREQENKHILDWLNENNIPYTVRKLDTADYSAMFPNYKELRLDKKFIIEKKNSITEICGNFTSGRERFAREFERVTDEHLHLVIENATWTKIKNGDSRSKMKSQAIIGSILSWSIKYNFKTWFVTKQESPMLIYNLLKYETMVELKRR